MSNINDMNRGEYGTGGNVLTRSLYGAIPSWGHAVGSGLMQYALQADARRPGYGEIVRELRGMGKSGALYGMPEGLSFDSIDSSIEGLSPRTILGAHYNPGLNRVTNVQRGKNINPGLMAHELGHAQQFANPNYKILNRLRNVSQGLTMFGVAPQITMLTDDVDTAKFAAKLGTAATLPMLGHELDASFRGRALLKRAAENSGQKLGFLRSFSPFKGVPSYALAAALPWATYKFLES
tara:strand:- start:2104 stop:2814 length:711 start_codon:yes stop_codon:yes gene_type:complete